MDGTAASLHSRAGDTARSASRTESLPDVQRFYDHSADFHDANAQINVSNAARHTVGLLGPIAEEVGAGAEAVLTHVAQNHLDRRDKTHKEKRDEAIDGKAYALADISQRETTTFAMTMQKAFRKRNHYSAIQSHSAQIGRQAIDEKYGGHEGRRDHFSTQIQRVARGHNARQREKGEKRKNAAATKIGALARGISVRQEKRQRIAVGDLAANFAHASGSKTTGAERQERNNKQSLHTQISGHLQRAAKATNKEDRESAEAAARGAGQQWLNKRSSGFGRISKLFEGQRHKATKDLVGHLSARQTQKKV